MKLTNMVDHLLRHGGADNGRAPEEPEAVDALVDESPPERAPRANPGLPDWVLSSNGSEPPDEPAPPAPAASRFELPPAPAPPSTPWTGTDVEQAVAPAPSADLPAAIPTQLPDERRRRLETAAACAETLGLGFHLGSALERIAAASGRGSDGVDDLNEAAWLIQRYVELIQARPVGADLHASSARLARTGEAIAALRETVAALDPPQPEPASD